MAKSLKSARGAGYSKMGLIFYSDKRKPRMKVKCADFGVNLGRYSAILKFAV